METVWRVEIKWRVEVAWSRRIYTVVVVVWKILRVVLSGLDRNPWRDGIELGRAQLRRLCSL